MQDAAANNPCSARSSVARQHQRGGYRQHQRRCARLACPFSPAPSIFCVLRLLAWGPWCPRLASTHIVLKARVPRGDGPLDRALDRLGATTPSDCVATRARARMGQLSLSACASAEQCHGSQQASLLCVKTTALPSCMRPVLMTEMLVSARLALGVKDKAARAVAPHAP